MLHDTGDGPAVSFMGPCAMLFEARGAFSLEQQARIWSLAQRVSDWSGLDEVVPGMTNLLLVFDRPPTEPGRLAQDLLRGWETPAVMPPGRRRHEIGVTYGGDHAIDLPAVAARAGLTPEEVVRIHAAGEYAVFALGSSPGFAYLGGLDPRIFTPRKSVPSLNMVRGSVTIGGMQTGVSVSTGPNGWNAIGFAEVDMFDPLASPPSCMAPGDTVRFRIDRLAL